MSNNVDIDSLLEMIESSSTANQKTKGKKKKQNTQKVEENKPLTTNDIVQVFEDIKINSNPGENTYEKHEVKIEDVVQTDLINTETLVQLVDPEKKKKKRKKKKKNKENQKEEEESEDEEDGKKKEKENEKEQINKYKAMFDFSQCEINNSRFQDNESVFRVLKNWQDKEWRQT